MTKAIAITSGEMHDFLANRGFAPLVIPGTYEKVYGRVVAPNICLRVYTSIEGHVSRGTGQDAIRCVLVMRNESGDVKIIGCDKRVHRVAGWRANLADRITNWRDMLGPACPKCGKPTIRRESRRGPFWGCSDYPNCVSYTNISEPAKRTRKQLVSAS